MVFNRSLVNWYCNNHLQEDSETLTATDSNSCSGFSSCANIKVHSRSYNLTKNLCRDKKKAKKASSKTNTQRNNGLCYFTKGNEKLKKNYEDSSQENTQKVQRQSIATATSTAGTDQVFANTGGETVFDFKHFTDPEEVLTEYINAHIYKKTRLEKVDKKKIFASIIELQNISKDTSTESNEPRVENTCRCDKLGTKVLKLGKRFPTTKFMAQRTTATSNFVFELGALDATNLQNNESYEVPTIEGIKGQRFTFNAQENARDKTNERKAYSRRVQKSISLLPKLSSAELARDNGTDNSKTESSIVTKTVLPNIIESKNSSKGENRMQKSLGNKNKLNTQVDQYPAVNRSNWQILKQKRNLTHGKDFINSWQSKKLCDTLEKISSNTCREKYLYLDSKTNNYSKRRAIETLRSDKPRGKKSLISKVFDNSLEDTTTANRNEQHKSKGRVLKFKEEENTDRKYETGKCLDEHSQALVTNISDDNREEEIMYPSSKVVADILAKLNIHDVGFHINAKKEEKLVNATTSSLKYRDLRQIVIPEKLNSISNYETAVKVEEKPLERLVAAKCGPSSSELTDNKTLTNKSELFREENGSLFPGKRSCGASQTDKMAVNNKSAFIEMSLKSLEGRIPRHLGTQILKSDFLRKDLSFKPANFFRTSINFNNPLNSSWNLMFSIDNSRSDIPQQGKWLKQKIQRIVMGSSKNEAEPLKIIEKSKVDKNYKKLHKIINEKFFERKDKINSTKTMRHSFAQKFLNVQTDILLNPRLQAVLPGLVNGIKNLAEKRAR